MALPSQPTNIDSRRQRFKHRKTKKHCNSHSSQEALEEWGDLTCRSSKGQPPSSTVGIVNLSHDSVGLAFLLDLLHQVPLKQPEALTKWDGTSMRKWDWMSKIKGLNLWSRFDTRTPNWTSKALTCDCPVVTDIATFRLFFLPLPKHLPFRQNNAPSLGKHCLVRKKRRR